MLFITVVVYLFLNDNDDDVGPWKNSIVFRC